MKKVIWTKEVEKEDLMTHIYLMIGEGVCEDTILHDCNCKFTVKRLLFRKEVDDNLLRTIEMKTGAVINGFLGNENNSFLGKYRNQVLDLYAVSNEQCVWIRKKILTYWDREELEKEIQRLHLQEQALKMTVKYQELSERIDLIDGCLSPYKDDLNIQTEQFQKEMFKKAVSTGKRQLFWCEPLDEHLRPDRIMRKDRRFRQCWIYPDGHEEEAVVYA